MKSNIYKIVSLIIVILIAVGVVAWFNAEKLGIITNPTIQNGSGGTVNVTESSKNYSPKDDGVIKDVVTPIEKQADQVIDITTAGFSPDIISVKKGSSIIWTNRDKAEHWIYNTDYTEKGACGTKFNSCAGLKLGENLRVTFDKTGTWNYIDKLNPKFKGQVTVN